MRAVLATSNPGKIREAREILHGAGLELATVPLWLGEVETGSGYLENARLKAAAVMRLLRRPVLAEDSGLEVDALDGLPGPRSARFAGPAATDEDNNSKLLRLLADTGDERRGARYRATAVLLLPSGEEIIGEGTFSGRIGRSPRGSGGFGYDPLFLPDSEERTVAEMSAEEKSARSHRGAALRQLVERARGAGIL